MQNQEQISAFLSDIISQLKNNAILQLDLSNNEIGDAGAQAISTALKNNLTLTMLDLSANQIGDIGAQSISAVLKDNCTLTALNLQINHISAVGAQAFSTALKDKCSLTTLDLRDNLIKLEYLQEIQSLTARNQQAMQARRQLFIYKMILLAFDAKNPHSTSLWGPLPREIKLLILSYLHFQAEATLGKTAHQIIHCAKFIFENSEECHHLVKAKQKIKLVEQCDLKGNYHFHFFKPVPISRSSEPSSILEAHCEKKAPFNRQL